MNNKVLYNPFKYIAGWESLLAGIAVLLATSVIGYYSHINFPDLISVKTTEGIPFYILLIENGSNWLVLSILLYVVALIFSPSSVRAVDIFGTQALARFPYLLAAITGFSGSIDKFGHYTVWNFLHMGEPVEITSGEITLAIVLLILNILFSVWMVALMFNAFKISANMKGTKLTVSFIIAIVVSTILTAVITSYFYNPSIPLP